MASKMPSENTIKVVARFRPPNKLEIASGGEQVVAFETDDTCKINSREGQGAFTFDRVFDTSSRQQDVFNFSIRTTVDDILNGYNGTVFAYGQTGAGKSFTMMGGDIDDPEYKGIIPRIVEQIFASILASPGNTEYTVRVSYMEIYMERIRDLLQPQNDNLPIHEEKSRGVYVKGLLEIYVSSVQEVFEVMRRGGTARAVAATNMNQESSRSHSIFVITVTQKNVETGSAKSGQLFLVDLAGSEKVGKTGASGQTLEEAKKINKSLSALGMVINSLTDGKSTHIPYRDSKLTRILQESLGGNSRTTLIINCSPSSYNVEETLGTLRFGMRAKTIKNKAKVNAELSPAELKALLKRAQAQVTTYENYLAGLESEVQQWRGGSAVPEDKWTQPFSSDRPSHGRTDSFAQRPETPAMLRPGTARAETPNGRSESRMGERAVTPTPIDKDERDEFLRRENELQDQIAEKESMVAQLEKNWQEAKEEIESMRTAHLSNTRNNETLGTELNELRLQLERVQFEGRDATITMDALRDANVELTSELDDVKQQLLEAKIQAQESSAAFDEKERKKAERMAQMMSGFEMVPDDMSESEKKLQWAVNEMDKIYESTVAGEPINPDLLESLRQHLLDTQGVIKQADLNGGSPNRRTGELENALAALQKQYQSVLEGKLSASDIEDVKSRLAGSYADMHEMQISSHASLIEDLAKKEEEIRNLQIGLEQSRTAATMNGHGGSGKSIQQQIADFGVMKKSLMRDLQNRCERVVELEISLDETREQYNNVLRTSNNRAQQKKMAFLERNLEQLTVIQRQLVDQNSSLKKEVAIAERKLVARNERILSLEQLLGDSQEKLVVANHKFEGQLAALKDRLASAKQNSLAATAQPNSVGTTFGGFLANAGSRIAKPLRGGGDGSGVAPLIPTFSNLQMQAVNGDSPKSKRGTWFFERKQT